ncbi:MAG: hypothetical protein GWM87_05475 [Xanthomonadales bacterium]|nr:hypothetical protein [Xanthomonadales bacterium]NIX12435.1 hypothetical protein [Xanthomonadales bacterium]
MSICRPSFMMSRRFSLIPFSSPTPTPTLTGSSAANAFFTTSTTSDAASPRTCP